MHGWVWPRIPPAALCDCTADVHLLRSAAMSHLHCCLPQPRSWNAFPHRVTFVVDKSAVPKAAPKTWQWSAKSWANKPLPRLFPVSHIVDEQGKNVTFAKKDTFVQGGGVIHSINAVSHCAACRAGCCSCCAPCQLAIPARLALLANQQDA